MKLTKPRKHILGMAIALVLSAPLSAANNEVIINQNSTAVAEGNLAEVHQSGDINLAAVDQAGGINNSSVQQDGVWLEAYNFVAGNDNQIRTEQLAEWHIAYVDIAGNENTATVTQDGFYNTA